MVKFYNEHHAHHGEQPRLFFIKLSNQGFFLPSGQKSRQNFAPLTSMKPTRHSESAISKPESRINAIEKLQMGNIHLKCNSSNGNRSSAFVSLMATTPSHLGGHRELGLVLSSFYIYNSQYYSDEGYSIQMCFIFCLMKLQRGMHFHNSFLSPTNTQAM